MKKISFLYALVVILCFGCSSPPISSVGVATNTSEKALIITSESMPSAQPTPLSPCANQAPSSAIVPIYQNDRIYQLSLQASRIIFSSDSEKVFLNTNNGIYILDTNNAQLICVIPSENASPYGLTVSQDGSLLASINIYGKITITDANNGLIIRKMQTVLYESQSLNWVELSDDGSLLVSSGYLQPVTVWDTQSGQVILETLGDHAAISPDGKFLALRGSNYTQIIDIQRKASLTTKVDDVKEPYFQYLLFSRDENYLYGLNEYSEIKVWDVHTGKIIQTINPYTIKPCLDSPCNGGWLIESPRMTLSADGSKLLLVDPSQITVWNTQTWEKIMSENNFDNHPLFDAAISPDGKKIIVTFAGNGPIRFFYMNQ